LSYYYDTSALCQNYHREEGSTKVEALLVDQTTRHVISRLTHLEIQSAFALKVRTGEIAPADFDLLRKRFRADVHQRRFVVVRLLRRHFDAAEKLIVKHAATTRLRTLDALHLAIALDLNETNIANTFVCADGLFVQLARREGLVVANPLEP
jgi:predicted nucleic acid-binding protein